MVSPATRRIFPGYPAYRGYHHHQIVVREQNLPVINTDQRTVRQDNSNHPIVGSLPSWCSSIHFITGCSFDFALFPLVLLNAVCYRQKLLKHNCRPRKTVQLCRYQPVAGQCVASNAFRSWMKISLHTGCLCNPLLPSSPPPLVSLLPTAADDVVKTKRMKLTADTRSRLCSPLSSTCHDVEGICDLGITRKRNEVTFSSGSAVVIQWVPDI